MPVVAGRLELVVEFPHEFRSLDVDRILVTKLTGSNADDETELLYMIGQLGELEFRVFPPV